MLTEPADYYSILFFLHILSYSIFNEVFDVRAIKCCVCGIVAYRCKFSSFRTPNICANKPPGFLIRVLIIENTCINVFTVFFQ